MSPAWLAISVSASVLAGFTIDRLLHPGRKLMKQLGEFFEDWNGQPARLSPDGKVVLRDRQPGVPERLETIEHQLNGGGLGSQMTALDAKVTAQGEQITEHIDSAEITRDELVAAQEQLATDVREVRADMLDAVTALADGQRRLEHRLGEVDEKVNGQLATANEKVEHLGAALAHALEQPDGSDGGGRTTTDTDLPAV